MAKSLLINSEETLINIPVYFKRKKNKSNCLIFVIYTEEEGKKKMQEGDKEVEILNTKWLPQTWSSSTQITKMSTVYNSQTR